MSKIVLKNCIIFKSDEFENIKEEINKYDKEKNEVIIKFLKTEGIIVVISNLKLNNIENKVNLKKQSTFVISNIEMTKYKIKDFNNLKLEEIKYMKSKNIIVKKNNDNGEYYLINKKFYNVEDIFEEMKKGIEEITSKKEMEN